VVFFESNFDIVYSIRIFQTVTLILGIALVFSKSNFDITYSVSSTANIAPSPSQQRRPYIFIKYVIFKDLYLLLSNIPISSIFKVLQDDHYDI